MKLKVPDPSYLEHRGTDHEEYSFHCPGCKGDHWIPVKWGHKSGRSTPQWAFNGNLEKPTFSPSLLVSWVTTEGKQICHSFIVDGKIQFLSDCTHALAGQTVDLEEVE